MTVTRPAQNALLSALDNMTQLHLQNTQTAVEQNSAATDRASLTLLAAASVLVAIVTCLLTIRVLMRQLDGEPAQAQSHGGDHCLRRPDHPRYAAPQ